MVDFTIAELNSDTGKATADGLRNVANVAADAICSAWENYAAATTGFPDPTGIGAFNNGLFSRLCRPRGFDPDPPVEEFTGGQCPIRYNVSYVYGSSDPEGAEPTFPPNDGSTLFNVPGPIGGGAVISTRDGKGKQGIVRCGVTTDFPDGFFETWIAPGGYDYDRFKGAFVTVVSVTPTNPDQPDVCGDPPPTYPPIVPPIPVFDFDTTVDVGGVNLDVNVSINPVIFAVGVAIKPEVNVQVGPFQVVFDAGGVDIFINPQNEPPVSLPPGLDPRPDRPDPKPPTGGGGEECPDCICEPTDLTEVLDKLEDIIECVCDEDEFLTQSFGSAKGNLVTVPTYIKSAVVDVVEIGAGVRSQLGEGTAPDVFYVGWAAFGVGSKLGQRFPLSFGSNVFLTNSKDVTSFAYSLNFDSVGVCSVEYLKEDS